MTTELSAKIISKANLHLTQQQIRYSKSLCWEKNNLFLQKDSLLIYIIPMMGNRGSDKVLLSILLPVLHKEKNIQRSQKLIDASFIDSQHGMTFK